MPGKYKKDKKNNAAGAKGENRGAKHSNGAKNKRGGFAAAENNAAQSGGRRGEYANRGANAAFAGRSARADSAARGGAAARAKSFAHDSAAVRGHQAERSARPEGSPANAVEGRNAVIELLRSGRDADKIYVAKDAGGSIAKITALARERGVPVSYCDKRKLDSMSATHAHQGVIALASAVQYSTVEQALELARRRGQAPLLVACDGVTDSGNLGAIIRSAEIFGAHGVIISKHGSAGLNAAGAKAAAGALEYVPVIRCASLASQLDSLKKQGMWIVGMDGGGSSEIFDLDFAAPTVIIIGSEGEGMSRLVSESCDFIAKIPMSGRITSLNASAAAAVALYAACRKRSSR